MPFFEAKKIYSRCQGNAVYNFYRSADDQLVAELLRDGVAQRLPVAVPADFRTNLDEEKVSKLTMMFEQSYFTVTRGELTVNARGLGGWGRMQHKGYRPSRLNPLGTLVWFSPKEGTYRWANQLGFSISDSKKIGKADDAVDYGATAPERLFDKDAQSWHFNTNSDLGMIIINLEAQEVQLQCSYGSSPGDSRIQHAVSYLLEAIDKYNKGDRSLYLKKLGIGLHPLQDIFAHTDDFVTRYVIIGDQTWSGYSHANQRGIGADDTDWISGCSPLSSVAAERTLGLNQRYSDAKTISYLYLLFFLYATGLFNTPHFRDSIQSIVTELFSRITDGNVGKFRGFIDAVRTARNQLFAGMPAGDLFYSLVADRIGQCQMNHPLWQSAVEVIRFENIASVGFAVARDIVPYSTHIDRTRTLRQEEEIGSLEAEARSQLQQQL